MPVNRTALPSSLKSWRALVLAILVGTHSCAATDTKQSDIALAPTVREHLDELIELAQTQSINRTYIDWSSATQQVLSAGQHAETVEASQNAVRLLLELLNDGHSAYQAASAGTRISVYQPCSAGHTSAPVHLEHVAYVRVSGSARLPQQDAEEIQQQIQRADKPDLVGWIVDLRGNTGGTIWPMIVGIGPILGEGTSAYFVDSDGRTEPWGYSSGAAVSGGVPQLRVERSYTLRSPAPRVAVLIDQATVSAGEMIAVAFRGRENTRIFGEPTCGRSSVNRAFRLGNGAVFYLTVGQLADRNGKVYNGRIPPDEWVGETEIVGRAVEWLRSADFSSAARLINGVQRTDSRP